MRNLFRRTDIWLAALITLTSGVVSAVAFQQIAGERLPSDSIIATIPNGDHRYKFVTNSGCIGELKTSMKFSDDQYEFRSEGEMRFSFQGHEVNPKLEFEGNFNSIGQLGGTRGTFQAPGVWIRFGSTEIDPIQFKVRTVLNNEQNEYETLLPGPVALKYDGRKNYRVEYPHLGTVIANYKNASVNPGLLNFLPRMELEATENECPAEKRVAMDLSLLRPVLSNTALSGLFQRAP